MTSSSKVRITQELIDELYSPDYFYEHGDNPANRDYMAMVQENNREGRFQDLRTYSSNNCTRFMMHRNVKDFLERDLKLITLPRVAIGFAGATFGMLGYTCALMRLYPIGMYGIKSIAQT